MFASCLTNARILLTFLQKASYMNSQLPLATFDELSEFFAHKMTFVVSEKD